jgi:hypothetical protein
MNAQDIARVIAATAVAQRQTHYCKGALVNLAYARRHLEQAMWAEYDGLEVAKDFSLRIAEMFMEFAVAEQKLEAHAK